MAVTPIAIWSFSAGTGTTIAADVGSPDLQSFGNAGGWYGNGDGLGEGYRVQYNAAPNATGSALISGVHGATKLITCFVFRTGSTPPGNGQVLFSINADENADAQRRWTCYYNGGEIRLVFNNTEVLSGTSGTALAANTLYRLWVVCDTDNANANLRFRMYFQGAAVSASVTTVTQGTAISITTAYDELVCGVPFGAAAVASAGYSHYLGFWSFDGAFDEAALLAADAVLAANNDTADNPFAAGGGEDVAELGATFSGAAAFGAGLSGSASMAGTFDGAASWSAALLAEALLSSSFAGAGTVAGNLAGAVALSSSFAGEATFGAALVGSAALGAVFDGAGSFSGGLAGGASLGATYQGATAFTGALVGRADLAGAFDGEAAFDGDLSTGAESDLSGSFDGAASFAANLVGHLALAGAFAGESDLSGNLTGRAALAASFAGEGATSGGLGLATRLSGAAAGGSTLTGALGLATALAGSFQGSGAFAADLSVAGFVGLSGVFLGLASFSGNLTLFALFPSFSGAGAVVRVRPRFAASVRHQLRYRVTITTRVVMSQIFEGSEVRIEVAVTNAAGQPVDATGASLTLTSPSGVETEYALGVAPYVQDGVGRYHLDLIAAEPGTWHIVARGMSVLGAGANYTGKSWFLVEAA